MSRKEKLTLLATILGSTIVFLDSTVVNVALPAIQADLDTGLAGQQWIVEAYMLTLVSLLLVGGSLGDLYGRKRTFIAGLAGFGITSMLCAVAPSDAALIGARALQGIAGALLVPGSLAILAATFEGEARGRAVGLWTAWAGISTLIGPAGGGLLVEIDWRWIFWVNIPLIAATIWLALRAVDESTDPEAVRGIDGVGISLSAIGLAGPVFALIEQPLHGFSAPIVWAPLVGGVLCFAAFVRWEARARAPMLPLVLFRSHNFSAVNLATLCVYAGLIGAFFFITLFLQQVAGYTPFQAGAATTPVTVLMFLLSGRFGALASRIGPRLVMGIGPLVGAVGLALLIRVDSDPNYILDVLPSLLLFGFGLSMTVAPLTTTVLDGKVGGETPTPAAQSAIDDAKDQPLSGGEVSGVAEPQATALKAEITDASEGAFHLGILIGAGLMALGGPTALVSVRNPAGASEPEPRSGPGSAARLRA